MRNSDMPAAPNETGSIDTTGALEFGGLTKREFAAIHIAAGSRANPTFMGVAVETAKGDASELLRIISTDAVRQADALFDELERKPEAAHPDPGPMYCAYCGARPPYVPGCKTDDCPHKETGA